MHIVKTTKTKKGRKSHKKITRSDYVKAKEKAVGMVMANLQAQAKKIEMNAVTQILEKHIGRKLIFEDVLKIERVANEGGYVLRYNGVPLGEITRHKHVDHKQEKNYKVTFQHYV